MYLPPVEVACDESGFSGTNLVDTDTEVLAHASVRLSTAEARRCVDELRARTPRDVSEYKSNHLLRGHRQPVPQWFLGPSGPVHGRARVHLTDKSFYVVLRLVSLLLGDFGYAAGTSLDSDPRVRVTAATLHHGGPALIGPGPWRAFLGAFVASMRPKRRDADRRAVEAFCASLAEILAEVGRRPDPFAGPFADERDGLSAGVEPLCAALADQWRSLPPLEPLIPAIIEAARHWGLGGRAVSIVHDEQSALTPHRIAAVRAVIAADRAVGSHRPTRSLSVRQVDSRSDPRVQVADLLAGAARRIATAELRGRGDAAVTRLLAGYLDPGSIWIDDASWSRLRSGRDGQATLSRTGSGSGAMPRDVRRVN